MGRLVAAVGLGAFALGCADTGGRSDGGASQTGISVGSQSSAAEVGSDASAGSGSGSGEEGDAEVGGNMAPVLDVGAATNASAEEGGDGEGCTKVDFLFVIDNSSSMGDEQDSLITSFPGFMLTIQNTLTDAQDYHVMVVDTDALWGGECEILCGFFGGVCPDNPSYPCGEGPPSMCETTLGAGVTYPMGGDATNMQCNFSSGMRYMDVTEPNLPGAFQCAAKVGSDGDSDEKAASSLVSSLSADLTGAGACNEGFIRDDAILVITLITDEEDKGSTGVPEGWFANVIASKAGDATAIVMLGLINDPDQPAPVCPPETEDPLKLRTFVEMFPNHIRGSICEISYNAFFEEAVALIDQTCDDFTPAG
ncbi:MAG TPA: hypothetical protein VG755_17485 [Nannocystaceae bacterium]|nr:hypothetical protein [Nannocystaceae bacterium]